jgi:hypothetical protein
MAKAKEPQVYFVDGCVARKNLVGIPAYVHGQPEVERTFFYMYSPDDDDWGYEELQHDIVSVVYLDRSWRLLSKRGVVVKITASATTEEEIDQDGSGPVTYGYLSKLRLIEDILYACGMSRHVYKRTARGWKHIDQAILADEKATHFCFESARAGAHRASRTPADGLGWWVASADRRGGAAGVDKVGPEPLAAALQRRVFARHPFVATAAAPSSRPSLTG